MENSLYQVLGLSSAATAQEIKDAYRQLVRLHHPDANPEQREAAEEMMKDVLVAYATLSDPQKRARYDVEEKLREFEDSLENKPSRDENSGVVHVMHHPARYSAPVSNPNPSLIGKVRTALQIPAEQFAARIGISEQDLASFEARDAMPQTPIQLRTFTHLVEQAANNLDAAGKTSDAIDLRTSFGRKKANRHFYR